jgi:hypothetical protein
MADTLATSQMLGALALQAIDVLDDYAEGRAVIGDAMLLVEVRLLDDEGEQVGTATHHFATSRRAVVKRGLVESCRDGLAENSDELPDDFWGAEAED